jgi:hypothetical protein
VAVLWTDRYSLCEDSWIQRDDGTWRYTDRPYCTARKGVYKIMYSRFVYDFKIDYRVRGT